jgi:D-alanyl-D-alanine carboxypeptidase/D-alanyl-D-alanine-endopeptidase (penicillin-binding protein 4)
MRHIILIALIVGLVRVALTAAPAGLAAHIAALKAHPSLAGARCGIMIQSLGNGEVWYAREANELFVPASTAKIVTVAVALDRLGPDYRFATRVYTDGTVDDGVLTGNLYLRGEGDPSLMPDDLRALARVLAEGDPEHGVAPIRAVRGALITDATFFPGAQPIIGEGWEADDLLWYYAAPTCALSCRRNAMTLTVNGTAAGQRPSAVLEPALPPVRLANRAHTDGGVQTGAIDVTRHGDTVVVAGRVAPGATLTERISVPHPERFAGLLFQNALLEAGITVGAPRKGAVAPALTPLAVHESAPLSEVIVPLMKESDNHMAEQLRWTMISRLYTEQPLARRFPLLVEDFFGHTGVGGHGIALVDGSGLSRRNRLTPAAAVRTLTQMVLTPNYDAFYRALPIAGRDGTMRKRLIATPAQDNARCKTGTMRGISCLAGYVTTRGGEPLVYAIFINGYTAGAAAAREMQDGVVSYLAGTE